METTDEMSEEKSRKIVRRYLIPICSVFGIILAMLFLDVFVDGDGVLIQFQSLKSSFDTLFDKILKLKFPKPAFILQALQSILILPEQYINGVLRTSVKEVGHEKIDPEENASSGDKILSFTSSRQPEGASILYVNTFCSQLFSGRSNLELCRTEVKQKCDIDVLAWFRKGPAESVEMLESVQDCVTNMFHMESDFIETLNSQVRKKESNTGQKDGSHKKKSSMTFMIMMIGLVIILLLTLVLGGVKYYKWKEQKRKEKEMNLKIQELEGQAVHLEPENYGEEPDVFTDCQELDISEEVVDETADIVHDIDPYLNMWTAFFQEVHLRDESAEDFENENIPELLYLNISLQEDLFENARVGSTVINDCEFEINEDSVIVTGFTVNKDNPLEFTFWRKMLRDVREMLKADALAKLKLSCPTLFAMGWFKENLPKSEEELEKEEEEFSKECL